MAAVLPHLPQTRLNPKRLDWAPMLNLVSNQCSKTALDSLHRIATTLNETTEKHDNADLPSKIVLQEIIKLVITHKQPDP